MLNGLLQNTTVPILEQVVNFSQARHNLLAGNIANLDTPGYQARDLSTTQFESHLQQLVEERRQPALETDSASMLPELAGSGRNSDLAWGTVMRHDLVDVTLEEQIAQLSKNQMQHNLAISIMTSQFRLLQAAISERA
ncbi:MAG: flagellar basal body rod protein FlgB [Pirellulales bacterium]|nr:flagellar basal body rod protein FlgB [Pirellulales bacterium]